MWLFNKHLMKVMEFSFNYSPPNTIASVCNKLFLKVEYLSSLTATEGRKPRGLDLGSRKAVRVNLVYS